MKYVKQHAVTLFIGFQILNAMIGPPIVNIVDRNAHDSPTLPNMQAK